MWRSNDLRTMCGGIQEQNIIYIQCIFNTNPAVNLAGH